MYTGINLYSTFLPMSIPCMIQDTLIHPPHRQLQTTTKSPSYEWLQDINLTLMFFPQQVT